MSTTSVLWKMYCYCVLGIEVDGEFFILFLNMEMALNFFQHHKLRWVLFENETVSYETALSSCTLTF